MFPSSDHFLAIVRGFITEYMRTFLVGVGPHYLSCAVAQFAQDLSQGIYLSYFLYDYEAINLFLVGVSRMYPKVNIYPVIYLCVMCIYLFLLRVGPWFMHNILVGL